MAYPYPVPMGDAWDPVWAAQAGKATPGWAGWTPTGMARPAPPGWYPPAGMAPPLHGYYPPDGWSRQAEPVMIEWMALIEPALVSVLPAIHGLLQISGMLLSQGPLTIDMPGPEPTEFTPGEPSAMSFGLGHLGLFGAAEAERGEAGPGLAEA